MTVGTQKNAAIIDKVAVLACKIPTSSPEWDGTNAWNSTTIVVVEAAAAGENGNWLHICRPTARLIEDSLVEVIRGKSALRIPAAWAEMVQAIRTLGRPGITSRAIAAGCDSLGP